MKLRTILTSLFILLLLSQSAIAINSDVAKNPLLSFEPELYMKSINGSDLHVLKGSDEPYTGLTSITSSIWKGVVIKGSFVEGHLSLSTRVYYSKLTGEKLSGEFKTYYPDGTKYGVINLVDGKQDGVTASWYPNGKLKSTRNYSMGIEDGKYAEYYENGNKKQTGVSGPGESMQWTDWNISGYKESFYHFKFKDKPPISSKHWDSKGNPIHRPKDFQINITDEDDTITTIGNNDKGDNMMEFYVSIYMPLAIALLVLLPLLGVGMCWLYRRLRSKKLDNNDG
jgi:antitoxin component YwqK of YwqJK toxin-antitoxin module